MNEDKYQPCPCGSGRKLKFCCYENRASLDGASDHELACRAVEFPVSRCIITSGWQEAGVAQVIVVRQLPNLTYLLAAYLVDVFCLGVKNTFVLTRLLQQDVKTFLHNIPDRKEEIAYEDARSVLLGAVEYARGLGFEPHEDWDTSRWIVEGQRSFENKFEFGEDGKPFYIQGPQDDVRAIMSRLEPLVKKGEAHFLLVDDPDGDDDDESDFEDSCEEISSLLEDGYLEEAAETIELLSRDYPERWQPLFLMGTCLTVQGRADEAIPLFDQAIAIQPTPETYYNLAGAHRSLFHLGEWVACLKKVIELDGSRGSCGKKAGADLGEFSSSLRKTDGLTLEEWLERKVIFDQSFNHLSAGRFEQAIDGFNELLKVSPSHVQSYGNLGLAYAGLGRRDLAIACLDKAIALDPGYRPALDNRAAILALSEGEKLDVEAIGEVDFYGDRARARSRATPMPVRALSTQR